MSSLQQFYENVAPKYDTEFSPAADYQIPKILAEMYREHDISSGTVLDVGCGTGKISELLPDSLIFSGIDLSPKMLEIASTRNYQMLFYGDMVSHLKTLPENAFDHAVALSTLYFVKDFETVWKELQRVTRYSIFASLECFDEETIESMKNAGLDVYNHSLAIASSRTILQNHYLWRRPTIQSKRIFGDIIFEQRDT